MNIWKPRIQGSCPIFLDEESEIQKEFMTVYAGPTYSGRE